MFRQWIPNWEVTTHNYAIRKIMTLWRYFEEENFCALTDITTAETIDFIKNFRTWTGFFKFITLVNKQIIKFNEIMTDSTGHSFTEEDISYLQNFEKSLTPIFTALNTLNKNPYLGSFIPVLIRLRNDYDILFKKEEIVYLKQSTNKIYAHIKSHYKNFFDFHHEIEKCIIASCFIPAIKKKLSKIVPTESAVNLDNLRYETLQSLIQFDQNEGQNMNIQVNDVPLEDPEDDFSLLLPTPDDTAENSVHFIDNIITLELQSFTLNPSSNINILNSTPYLKKAFLKYNVSLASGQEVENKFYSQVYKEIICCKHDFQVIESKILKDDISSLFKN